MFSKCLSISCGCHISSLTAKAAIVGAALAATLAFISSANASMLVSAVLGWGTGAMVIPANGTVAAAPSAGGNEWNGFGANGAQSYNITFNPVDSNGNATGITGTFVETNPVSQEPWYDPGHGMLPPFVNFPAATWNGNQGTDTSSPADPMGPDTLTLSGLNPAGSYDVYVYSAYIQGEVGGNTPTVSLTLAKGMAATTSYTYTYNMNGGIGAVSSYTPGTNYEEFQNVTPDNTGSIAIAGTGVNTSLFNAFQLYAVPEPATLGLVGIGALGLLLIGRKRAARRSA